MADAYRAAERLSGQYGLEVPEFALGAAPLHAAVFERRHASGIVAAIFEAFEGVDDRPGDRTAAQDADNAAHCEMSLYVRIEPIKR